MSCDVSVVIPTYNSSGTLKRALDSVYEQSLPPREIIVVDDGSDDWKQSRRIVESYPDRIAIRFIHINKNQGPSAARNTGISAAVRLYLAFLDADDVWFKNKIAIQYGLMTSDHLDFSMHEYVEDINQLTRDLESPSSLENRDEISPLSVSPLSSWNLLFRNRATPTVMVSRQKMVPFDTSLRRIEDWKCWMQLLRKRECRGVYIRLVLAGGFKNGIGASGLSQDVNGMHAGRMLALKKLIEEGNISMVQYLVGISMETVKYPVRALLVAVRNRAAI
jgi:glycosyltransferase involved in cell wall biosynthesis